MSSAKLLVLVYRRYNKEPTLLPVGTLSRGYEVLAQVQTPHRKVSAYGTSVEEALLNLLLDEESDED